MNEHIVKILDELKFIYTDEILYEQSLNQLIKESQTRIKNNKNKKKVYHIKKFLNSYSQFVKLLKINVDHDIEYINDEYETADYHVYCSCNFKIGQLLISRTYTGDDEGDGYISLWVNNICLCEEYNEKDDSCIDEESFEEMTKNLKIQMKKKDKQIIKDFIMDVCIHCIKW